MTPPPTARATLAIARAHPATIDELQQLFALWDWELVIIPSEQPVLAVVTARLPDLILLADGDTQTDLLTICDHLQANPRTAAIPVVVLGFPESPDRRGQLFAAGIADYLPLPLQPEEVLTKLQRVLRCQIPSTAREVALQRQLLTYRHDHQATEAALRQSEARLSLALKAAKAGMWQWNIETNQAIWSEENYRLLGYQPGSCAATYENWIQAVHPDDRAGARAAVASVLAHQSTLHLEFRVLLPDGTERWIADVGQIIYDGQGEPTGLIGLQFDITPLKRAEAVLQQANQDLEARVQTRTRALQESEEKFRQLAEAINAVFWLFDPIMNRVLYVSPAYEQIWGQSTATLLEDSDQWTRVIHPDDRDRINALIPQLTQRKFDEEYRILRPDGEIRWIRDRSFPIYNDQGIVHRIAGVAEDISDRKAMEAALHHQIALDALIATISARFIDAPADQIHQVIGQAIAEIAQFVSVDTGYIFQFSGDGKASPPGNYSYFSMTYEWIAPHLEPRQLAAQQIPCATFPWGIAEVKQGKLIYIPDVTALPDTVATDRDGWRQFGIRSLICVPLRYQGVVTGWFGLASYSTPQAFTEANLHLLSLVGEILTNAMERQKAELALARSEAQNRALVDALPDMLVHLRVNGDYLGFWGSNNIKVLKPELMVPGNNITHVLPPDLVRIRLHYIQKAVQTRQMQVYEYKITVQSEIRWEEARIIAINDEEVLTIIRDITQRQQAEQEIRQLNQQLGAQNQNLEALVEQRTAELESFSYSVSHDLRAPLRHIRGFVDLLKQQLEESNTITNPRISHYLDVIDNSSQKMAHLIDGLLTLSRVGRRQLIFRSVDLASLLATAITLNTPQTGPSIEFRVGNLPTVQGDPVLLQQVFNNLLENAIKFSRKTTSPRIEIGCLDGQTIFVKDNGIGFQMAYAADLFAPFHCLHSRREFEGTGIGLAIVQRIIRRHGGRIWAESQPDQGATFFFTLSDGVSSSLPGMGGPSE